MFVSLNIVGILKLSLWLLLSKLLYALPLFFLKSVPLAFNHLSWFFSESVPILQTVYGVKVTTLAPSSLKEKTRHFLLHCSGKSRMGCRPRSHCLVLSCISDQEADMSWDIYPGILSNAIYMDPLKFEFAVIETWGELVCLCIIMISLSSKLIAESGYRGNKVLRENKIFQTLDPIQMLFACKHWFEY